MTGGSGLLATNWSLMMRDECVFTLGLHKRSVSISGIKTCFADLNSQKYLIDLFEKTKPDVVVHTAGLTNIEQCEASPDLAYDVNVKLTANVAKACKAENIKLVYISTDHLFAGNGSLVDETQPVEPINVYAQTKADAEKHVLKANNENLIIRTNFYGWGTRYRLSFSDLVLQTLRDGKALKLQKNRFFTPILIYDLVSAVHELIALNASGIYNIVGDDRISKYDFGLALAREFELEKKLLEPGYDSYDHQIVRRPADMSLSNIKARNLLSRNLGGVQNHLARLRDQEVFGLKNILLNL